MLKERRLNNFRKPKELLAERVCMSETVRTEFWLLLCTDILMFVCVLTHRHSAAALQIECWSFFSFRVISCHFMSKRRAAHIKISIEVLKIFLLNNLLLQISLKVFIEIGVFKIKFILRY